MFLNFSEKLTIFYIFEKKSISTNFIKYYKFFLIPYFKNC